MSLTPLFSHPWIMRVETIPISRVLTAPGKMACTQQVTLLQTDLCTPAELLGSAKMDSTRDMFCHLSQCTPEVLKKGQVTARIEKESFFLAKCKLTPPQVQL